MCRFSQRFGQSVVFTRHALARMEERGINEALVGDLIETGTIKDKDVQRKWIHKAYPERTDNLICVAVIIENAVVIKTVMIHWRLVEA